MYLNPETTVYFWLMAAVCLAILPVLFVTCGFALMLAKKMTETLKKTVIQRR